MSFISSEFIPSRQMIGWELLMFLRRLKKYLLEDVIITLWERKLCSSSLTNVTSLKKSLLLIWTNEFARCGRKSSLFRLNKLDIVPEIATDKYSTCKLLYFYLNTKMKVTNYIAHCSILLSTNWSNKQKKQSKSLIYLDLEAGIILVTFR